MDSSLPARPDWPILTELLGALKPCSSTALLASASHHGDAC